MNLGCLSPPLGQSQNKANSPQHSWEVGSEPTQHRGPRTKLVNEWVLSAILVWAGRSSNTVMAADWRSWDMVIQGFLSAKPVWPSMYCEMLCTGAGSLDLSLWTSQVPPRLKAAWGSLCVSDLEHHSGYTQAHFPSFCPNRES